MISTAEDAGLGVGIGRIAARIVVLLPLGQGRIAFLAAGDQRCGHGQREQQREEAVQSHRKRSRAAAAALRTFSGAVPPKLVRLAAECSGVRTVKTYSVIFGSTDRISARLSFSSGRFLLSARRTSSPVV